MMDLVELLPRIGPFAFGLLIYLISISVDGECAPGYADMRRATGYTNHHVSQSLAILEDAGLIARIKGLRTVTRIQLLCLQNSKNKNSRILECTTTLINLSSSTLQNSRILNIGGLESDNNDTTLGELSSAFVKATHIPELTGGPQAWIDALDEMNKAGVEPQDISSAVYELRSKNYSIASLRSIVRPAIMAMSKRKSSGNGKGGIGEYELVN
jgi:predicted transcriptional regulator